ncbi:hypothetical protein ZWY2020_047871 [Hordeum vulgare]|nr:hypothetical protein ZWY2020_047871 [Hordeum vulgare]
MRREGRQRGWVRVYDRALVDPDGNRRAVHVVDGQVVANGGYIRAPRKPTNQSSPAASARSAAGTPYRRRMRPQDLPPRTSASV